VTAHARALACVTKPVHDTRMQRPKTAAQRVCRTVASLAVFAPLALLACSSREPSAESAPGGDGTSKYSIRGGSKAPDGGMSMGAGEDAGMGGSAGECFELDDASPITLPADFQPTHVSATWSPDCTEPTVVLALSDDGCPDGRGHELTFFIEAAALDDTRIVIGDNPLPVVEPGGFDVRYRRESPLTPAGEWANCLGAHGIFTLDRFPRTGKGQVALGFELSLSDCTASGDLPDLTISGAIEVELTQDLDEACGG